MANTFTVPASQTYYDTETNLGTRYASGDVIPIEEAVRLGMPGAALPAAGSAFTAAQAAELAAAELSDSQLGHTHSLTAQLVTEDRTATAAPGGTTGVVSATTDHVDVTSDDANKVITLPVMAVGQKISLRNGATGYELRSSTPASIGINGGTGANAESAIAANKHVWCEGDTATNIICWERTSAGVLAVTEVAAP